MIAKSHVYGLELSALKLLQNYLSNRKQITKTDSNLTVWGKILAGVRHGSILSPLLFIIFICDICLTLHIVHFAGDADGNNPLVVRQNIKDLISFSKKKMKESFRLFPAIIKC